jgi:hypothetical protein
MPENITDVTDPDELERKLAKARRLLSHVTDSASRKNISAFVVEIEQRLSELSATRKAH